MMINGIEYTCLDYTFNLDAPYQKEYQGIGGMSNRIMTKFNWETSDRFTMGTFSSITLMPMSVYSLAIDFQKTSFFPIFRLIKESTINPDPMSILSLTNSTATKPNTFESFFTSNTNLLDYKISGAYPSKNTTFLSSFYVVVNVTNQMDSFLLLGDSNCIQYPIYGHPNQSTEYISAYTSDILSSTQSIDFVVSYFVDYEKISNYQFKQVITSPLNPVTTLSPNINFLLMSNQKYVIAWNITGFLGYSSRVTNNVDYFLIQNFNSPYGIIGGSFTNAKVSVVIPVSSNYSDSYNIKIFGGTSMGGTSPIPPTQSSIVPYIFDIFITSVGKMKSVITLDLVDVNSTFAYAMFTDDYSTNTGNIQTILTPANLVSRGSNSNRYQGYIDFVNFKFAPKYFLIFNSCNNFRMYDVNYPVNLDFKNFPFIPFFPFNLDIEDFIQVSFSPQINSGNSTSRTIYIQVSNVDLDYIFTFIPLFNFEDLPLASSTPSNILNNIEYKGYYNSTSKLFECTFIQPSNLYTGNIDYILRFLPFEFSSQEIILQLGSQAVLNVSSEWADQIGPLVTNIIQIPGPSATASSNIIGFSLSISDYVGIKEAVVVITSSINPSPIIFKENNLGREYNWTITFNSSSPCVPQTYAITDGYLKDYNNFTTYFNPTNYRIHSLMKFFDTPSIWSVVLDCPATGDTISPQLISLDVAKVQDFNIFSTDKRNLSVRFQVFDLNGLYPFSTFVYATDFLGTILKFNCISNGNKTHVSFISEFEIPYSFGYPNGIALSVYGVSDTSFNFLGLTTESFPSLFIDTMTTIPNYEPEPFITSTSIYNVNGTLEVFGFSFGTMITDFKFTCNGQHILLNTYFSNSYFETVEILVDDDEFELSCFISRIATGKISNTVIIKFREPKSSSGSISNSSNDGSNSHSNSNSQIEASSSSSLNTNQTCLNNCKNNGLCKNGQCICTKPWIGKDCSSQVIIIDQPTTDNEHPDIVIDYPNAKGVIVTSIISVVSIREININGQIEFEYPFKTWIYNNITDKSHLYITNITKDSIDIPINVTIDWFDDYQNITFANQQLLMLPSSTKYRINLNNYPFNSQFNYLQLVFKVGINSDHQEGCSSVLAYDSNQFNSQYFKLQVGDHSIQGRFINRAIVDGVIKSISNTFISTPNIDRDNNNYNRSSLIGIQIPFFKKTLIIDPDFSLLIDSAPADANDNESSICAKKSKSLSTAQLTGIIIGSVAFAAVAIISTTYIIFKKHQFNKNQKKLVSKLNKL
ncbi:hypothetical protein CYY_001659 [Polysphondylium violaceum]|uniref:EGF-like domain-containing protein n=1 Tax=Polysphondylium violaceum TaxID=133409 RepID=A0A8J4V7P6_9MYCE|nr:hypothetical protein CYY_001659 [Polysphondylium violaceum]